MADDLKDFRYDKAQDVTRVTGVLYRGDNLTKYSKPNRPFYKQFKSIRPEELAVVDRLDNETEASQFMLRAIDFDENARSVHPTVPSPSELQKFVNPPERHEAYASLWNTFTYLGVVANTAMWLYL